MHIDDYNNDDWPAAPPMCALVNQVHNCDALTLLRAMPSGSVDAVITDPPYGIGYASSWKTRSDGTPRQYDASFGEDVLDTTWLRAAARVMKDNTAMYLFTRWDVAETWKDAIEGAGLKVVQRIIWDKGHFGMGDLDYYGSQTEDILFCVKGKPLMDWTKREGNMWRVVEGKRFFSEGHWGHPTQKPIRLLKNAIVRSSRPGDLILDMFAGSGSTLVAAQLEGRHYIGGDISAEYVAIARKRLAQDYTPSFMHLLGA